MGSTIESLEVEVCSNCHPFYTGQDKVMDKVGRVQKFKERMAQKQEKPKKAGAGKKLCRMAKMYHLPTTIQKSAHKKYTAVR